MRQFYIDSLALLALFAFILSFALLGGCASPTKTIIKTQTKVETVSRCYHYYPFSDEEWRVLYSWLQASNDDYPPALVLKDYVRIRSINECEVSKND